MTIHQFGGDWTDDKLQRLADYLKAYLGIFTKNERAVWYTTNYVDAFAGTGQMNRDKGQRVNAGPMFLDDLPVYDEELESFQKGSARIALEMTPPFDRYLFVDKKAGHIKALETMREEFPSRKTQVTIRKGEANDVLANWCNQLNWRTNRAVVFLDPYGMSVRWETIERLAKTGGVDLWVLFPLGQAVNRLLMRARPPEGAWANSLTRIFGTTEWLDAFYHQVPTLLPDEPERMVKDANYEKIGLFFLKRLRTAFPYVADNPLYLYTKTKVPIYSLCFASANPTAGALAVKIAKDILGKKEAPMHQKTLDL